MASLLFPPNQICDIPVDELRPGPWQPRQHFDVASIEELAESISAHGVLNPLRVVRDSSGYLILAGERRWRAAELAGVDTVPCLIIDSGVDNGRLQQVALLDNLQRSNLRPGEEAQAVESLSQLGMTQRDLAHQLGKSQSWVSQRLATARLPEAVLLRLDEGSITREEALGLTKLSGHPDLLEACIEPEGKALRSRLGGHIPESLGERVQAVLRVLETHRQRTEWALRMMSEGHQVLDEMPRADDPRYVRLPPATGVARAHHEAKLTCEAWAWEHGQPIRYCTDPARLKAAMAREWGGATVEKRDAAGIRLSEERQSARDETIRTWLATSRRLESQVLGILARQRIKVLSLSDDRVLVRLGGWLGYSGDRAAKLAAAEAELASASDGRLIQLWFALELAASFSSSLLPSWARPWLEHLGFRDPADNSRSRS